MLDVPPSDAVVAVIEAARTGSMAAAATELGITHGAVSRRIQLVEHWLGAPIFERLGRGVRLTSQGQLFVRRAERSLAALASVRSELSTQRSLGVIRISALPSFARLWLMPRLRDFEAGSAGRIIDVVPEHRLVRLEAREADIAVRYGAGSWSGVDAHLLFRDQIVPAASPALAATLAGCAPQALMAQTLILDGDGADWRLWCRSVGVPYAEAGKRRRFLDYDLAVDAAQQGLGIILLRLPLASRAVEDGSLCPLNLPSFQSERGHFILTRANESRAPVMTLVDVIRRHVLDENVAPSQL